MYEDHYQAVPIVDCTEVDDHGSKVWYSGSYAVELQESGDLTLFDSKGYPHTLTKMSADDLVSAIVSATSKMEK